MYLYVYRVTLLLALTCSTISVPAPSCSRSNVVNTCDLWRMTQRVNELQVVCIRFYPVAFIYYIYFNCIYTVLFTHIWK